MKITRKIEMLSWIKRANYCWRKDGRWKCRSKIVAADNYFRFWKTKKL